MHKQARQRGRAAQRPRVVSSRIEGAALLLCLLLLVPLLLLGASAMESAVLSERMASTTEDHMRAFRAAEQAINSGESWLRRQPQAPVVMANGALGVWSTEGLNAAGEVAWWQHRASDLAWWAAHGIGVAGAGGLAQPPTLIVEQLATGLFLPAAESPSGSELEVADPLRSSVLYRLTALGVGRRATSRVRLQTTFLREFKRGGVSPSNSEKGAGNGAELRGRLSWRQLD